MRCISWLSVSWAFMIALAAVPASAEVVAEFNGGGSTASPVNTVVDAYLGMGGDGWTGPWVPNANTGLAFNAQTLSATPLGTGTGNYLDVFADSNGTSKGASVSRSYSTGIDLSQPHSIDFLYRVNETMGTGTTFTTSDDRYQLFGHATTNRTTATGETSWIIGCYGGAGTFVNAADTRYWLVYNGLNDGGSPLAAQQVNTGILVTTGTVYNMHLDVNPATKKWDVTISSGGTTLYDSKILYPGGLGWRTSSATVGPATTFGCFANASTDNRAYSVDSVRVTEVPEPSALVSGLTLLLAGGWALASRRR